MNLLKPLSKRNSILQKLRGMSVIVPLFVCAACSTFEPDIYTPLNYTEQDARRIEMERIEQLRGTSPVEALWRSWLLVTSLPDSPAEQEKQQFDVCVQTVQELYRTAETDRDYLAMNRYLLSLQAVDAASAADFSDSLSAVKAELLAETPGLTAAENSASAADSVADFINGTVTIWVDRGIRVERGMGYVDVVIGSGFFISEDGYIVTNYHVISSEVDPEYEGFSRLYIKLASDSDTRIPAKVVGWDAALDLALLKAEITAPYVFALGSSAGLNIGDRIYAIGSPVGLERTLTSGIVSAADRELFALGTVMQIDAAVNSGNSGGPLIDLAGNVQGIVFASAVQYQGLNFAIPVEYLKWELPLLYSGGERLHPWTGAYGHTLKDRTRPDLAGVAVDYIMPGGGADLGGIAVGDIITHVNGQPVSGIEQLHNVCMTLEPDTIIQVSGLREDGTLFDTVVYLQERPKSPGYEIYRHDLIAKAMLPLFGMSLTSIGKSEYVVSSVLKGSIADESGFSENDPIRIRNIEFSPENDAMFVSVYAKKRKNGYLDVNLGIAAPLDSSSYF